LGFFTREADLKFRYKNKNKGLQLLLFHYVFRDLGIGTDFSFMWVRVLLQWSP